MNNQTINHISIIGGAGHVGLPLGLAFASKNFKIHLIDKNMKALKNIQSPRSIASKRGKKVADIFGHKNSND